MSKESELIKFNERIEHKGIDYKCVEKIFHLGSRFTKYLITLEHIEHVKKSTQISTKHPKIINAGEFVIFRGINYDCVEKSLDARHHPDKLKHTIILKTF